jgi:hypothetical protein
MDLISVFIISVIISALRGPASAGRAVRADHQRRSARWQRQANAWRGRPAQPGVRGMPQRAAGRVRPGAIRTGIRFAALTASGLFAGGAAYRGFRRGWKAGYRHTSAYWRHREAWKRPGPITVEPGVPGSTPGKDEDVEIVDAEIVPEPTAPTAPRPAPDPADVWDAVSGDWEPERPPAAGLGPGTGPAPSAAPPQSSAPAPAPASPLGRPIPMPPVNGGSPMPSSSLSPRNGSAGGLITPAAIPMPTLLLDANYHNHLHNLGVLSAESAQQMGAAQLAVTSANVARQRAVNIVNATDQIAAGLHSQDFGAEHVGHVVNLQELLMRQAQLAAIAEQAARESIEVSAQVVAATNAAAAAFRRDHQLLAEAHAASPNPARTREAYTPQ